MKGIPEHTVEVFATGITEEKQAKEIAALLQPIFLHCRINFDLDDCDRILRMEGKHIDTTAVINLLIEKGIHCQLLE